MGTVDTSWDLQQPGPTRNKRKSHSKWEDILVLLFTLFPTAPHRGELRKPSNSQFLSQDKKEKKCNLFVPFRLAWELHKWLFQSCLTQRAARNHGVIGISKWRWLKAVATGRAAGALQTVGVWTKSLQAEDCNKTSKALRTSRGETLREIMAILK